MLGKVSRAHELMQGNAWPDRVIDVAPQVVHYTFDAILISTVLAGIRRSTGLGWAYMSWCQVASQQRLWLMRGQFSESRSVKVDKAGQGEVRSFLMSYLG